MSKPKAWSTNRGAAIGLLFGLLLWWSAFEPAEGLFQKPHLIILPAAFGIVIVGLRNRKKKVGSWDPETIAQNRDGRV
ncbi:MULTISPECIES: hypothetical protein [Sphingomonadales]|uniref:hypothetical protein n=1 Tax=Sphingomonadales TaxID=204457 RepID=UPI001C99C969|nr:hypothetical protein [Qipengyuania gaetbuli]MBY6015195.1 hypothetical protein [Qipengyuania gaetbuli]